MGLFDYALDVGKKLFGGDDDPAEKIKEHIEEDNPGIEGLEVTFEDGKAILTGKAESAEALEKAILMAGNAQGVGSVDASAVEAPAAEVEVEYYEIKSGDTLSAIAKTYYGNGNKYMAIFEANREVIKDPDLIFPGQKIRIPAVAD